MNPNAQQAVQRLLPHPEPKNSSGMGKAPANIALCKYWGKRDVELKLPVTGSLSISLGSLGSTTEISLNEQDEFVLGGTPQDLTHPSAKRLFDFLNLFRKPGTCLKVTSTNTIPMAAGLASSASGFASVVKALNALYGWELGTKELSILARIGSGSASRSIEHGFVEWFAGEKPDGSDSFAKRMDLDWPEFRIGILTLSSEKKSVGSSEGMKRTMETSTLYHSWPDEVSRALPLIRNAILQKDFSTLGKVAEQNALSMHATMISSWPPVLYWKPESVAVLHQVHALRSEGIDVYVTMDAGPNVKLLFQENQQATLQNHFPDLQVISPFAPTSQGTL